jgi:hypothetical protein
MWLDKFSGVLNGGDKPYGDFWLDIGDRPSPYHFPQKTKVGEKLDPSAPPGATGPMVDVFEWQAVWVLDQAAMLKAQVAEYSAAIQRWLDVAAQERGYDNVFTACTYAEEPAVPKFQAEGQSVPRCSLEGLGAVRAHPR